MRKTALVIACSITLAVAGLATGCGASSVTRPPVPIVFAASVEDRARFADDLPRFDNELPVALTPEEVPAAASEAAAERPDFGGVRRAYDDGDLETCLAALPIETQLDAWLEEGDRVTASRALFWRMACLRALGREDEARAAALEHAARGLPLPDDLGAANAVAETMLRDAHRAQAAATLVPLRLETSPPGAEIAIDGLPRDELTPSTLALAPGRHLVRVHAPTFTAHTWTIDVRDTVLEPIVVELARAEPEPTARVLSSRLSEGHALDDDLSLSLLVVALRSRATVLVSRDGDRSRAALVTLEDGALRGTVVRAERVGEAQWDLRGLLTDVLVRGSLMARPPEIYERPELWIAIAAAVLVGAGIAVGLSIQPDVRTRVTW
jgi:hypothetical protein